MGNRPGSRKNRFYWAPVLALWASVPAVLWCPPGWQRACASMLLRCAMPRTAMACADAGGSCPLMHGCPPAAPPSAAAGQRGHTFPFGRAFCLGDPSGGPGLLAQAPQVHPAPDAVAILPVVDAVRAPAGVVSRTTQLRSRPPPAPWRRRPPARAPPSIDRC